MKNVLLVGSSFSAAPICSSLVRKGYRVTVCGNIKDDTCHQYAVESLFVDYSDRAALLEAVKQKNFDYVVPTTNDVSYLSAAWLAEKLGVPGCDRFSTAEILHHKSLFRDFTSKAQLPAPKASVDRAGQRGSHEELNYPLLVKPADSFSGRGTTKVENSADLDAAIAAARSVSQSGAVTVEEFVEGTLHSHSAFLQRQDILHDVFVDEFCTVHPYQVNCSNHPSRLGAGAREKMRAAIRHMASELALVDGLLHTQFIANGDDVWIIECTRRSPGDLYGQFVDASIGTDYADLFTRPFVNEAYPAEVSVSAAKPMARHTISCHAPMIFSDFTHCIPAKSTRTFPLKATGDRLGAVPYDRLAILFSEFDTIPALFDVTPYLESYVTIHPLENTQ